MFSKKKETKPPSKRAGQSLAQYGLFDVPTSLDDIGTGSGSDEGDSDFEAELAALSGPRGVPKPRPKLKARPIPAADLDNLIASSLRDIPSDEDISDDEDDPDILNELSELTEKQHETQPETQPETQSKVTHTIRPATEDICALLEDRLKMYILAEQNAKDSGETGRARRFGRGLKTLKDQLRLAKAGKPVLEDDIPPVVSTIKHQPPLSGEDVSGSFAPSPSELPGPSAGSLLEVSTEVSTPFSETTIATINMLTERKTQYKLAALAAKKTGDNTNALAYLKMGKQFDLVIEAVRAGQTVDLSDMPGPPGTESVRQDDHVQYSAEDPLPPPLSVGPPEGLITANSVEDALQQRLLVYQEQESAAQEAGNTSKARRMGRIVKQYQQAIKQHSAGKPIPFDELPSPPGYAPIPGASFPEDSLLRDTPVAPSQPDPKPGLVNPTKPSKSSDKNGQSNSIRKMGNQISTGHVGKQLTILMQRQRDFKQAALDAKIKGLKSVYPLKQILLGELSEAKEYLRCAKGLDPLIEAAKGGLPVDLATVPLPPQAKQELEESYDIVTVEDCDPSEEGPGMVTARLEEQLNSQLKMCMETRDHLKALGDVAGGNRFEHLALTVKQDLDVVRMAKRLGTHSLKFHYESKKFSVVQCCTDLGDNDVELSIVRGISYTVANPKEIDTYVKFEFPYPQEEPVRDKTPLVKDTNSPEYNSVFTLPINRAARPCIKIFKRHAVKFEVYSRGCCGRPCSCPFPFFSGLFTRDSVIGTVNVKLQPLETQTILHDSFDLMDGRKTVGGKLEIKIRVRHPLLAKQVEQKTQKWLVIDH